jgi:Rps23 Pro-64 3,4-dihydroxylase Tpa1-like proline 4-hydroxylase
MDVATGKKKARADGAAPSSSSSSSSAAAGVPAKKHKPSGGGSSGAIPPASMNPVHTAPGAVESYAAAFAAGSPYPHLFVRDMFSPAILAAVKQELLGGTYFRKRNDLYDFAQTDDLKRATGNATAALREYIYSASFREWITRVTGVPVNDTLDASAASYTKGSYLLCHDDDLAERRIAWIIYLVPEGWDAADGGALDLFDLADPADPTVPGAVVRSLTPAWNSMAFFEVSAASHHQVREGRGVGEGKSRAATKHQQAPSYRVPLSPRAPLLALPCHAQVAEVLDDAKGPRLSISGWFHGPPVARPAMKPLPSPTFVSPAPPEGDDEDGDDASPAAAAAPSPKIGPPLSNAKLRDGSSDALTEWVNPTYLRPSVLAAMRAQFARDASLEVGDFLRPEVYVEVMRSLGTQRWDFRGPANAACYRACYDTSAATAADGAASGGGCVTRSTGAYNGILPDPLHRLWRFATGWQFQALVSALTGQPLDGVSGEVRCFTAGESCGVGGGGVRCG